MTTILVVALVVEFVFVLDRCLGIVKRRDAEYGRAARRAQPMTALSDESLDRVWDAIWEQDNFARPLGAPRRLSRSEVSRQREGQATHATLAELMPGGWE